MRVAAAVRQRWLLQCTADLYLMTQSSSGLSSSLLHQTIIKWQIWDYARYLGILVRRIYDKKC